MAIRVPKLSLGARVRHAIARWLFAEEVAKVDLERTTFALLVEEQKESSRKLGEYKAGLTVTDMVREQLAGFDPKLFDTDDDLPEVLGEVEAQSEFLSKCKALQENPALEVILAYLIRNQIVHSAKYAPTQEAINFGRATVNGVELFREEVARLAAVHTERHAAKPTFDEHEVV